MFYFLKIICYWLKHLLFLRASPHIQEDREKQKNISLNVRSIDMRNFFIISVLAIVLAVPAKADEGMWLPALIRKLNIGDMQKTGLRLSAEDLYSINNGSLKDAVVHIGGCTAEMISPEGLMLTNHHCAMGDIQRHSSVEHDYLRDGFWAQTREEELPNPSKIARFLISAEDVTDRVLQDVKEGMSFSQRQQAVTEASARIEKEAVGETHYEARVTPSLNPTNSFSLSTKPSGMCAWWAHRRSHSANSGVTPTTGCGPAIPPTFLSTGSIAVPTANLPPIPKTMCP